MPNNKRLCCCGLMMWDLGPSTSHEHGPIYICWKEWKTLDNYPLVGNNDWPRVNFLSKRFSSSVFLEHWDQLESKTILRLITNKRISGFQLMHCALSKYVFVELSFLVEISVSPHIEENTKSTYLWRVTEVEVIFSSSFLYPIIAYMMPLDMMIINVN